MERVLVLGPSGAGKSEFSRQLSLLTGLPVFSLDCLFWNADRTHVARDEFDRKLAGILSLEHWIIDGDYSRTYEARMERCDTIFFLDYLLDVCLGGVRSRIGTKRPDLPWVEEALDIDFEQWIQEWPNRTRPKLLELLEKYKDSKRIITFSNRLQASRFLQTFKG